MADERSSELTVIRKCDAIGSDAAPRNGARVVQAGAQVGDGARDATSAHEAVLQKLLAQIPNDSDAHEALARIYAEGGRWAELAELHAKRFDAVRDPGERAALLRRIASILRDRFDDDARAFEVLLDALREDFSDEETIRELEANARFCDRFGDLLVACNDWLRDPNIAGASRAALLTRVGVWYGDELGKPAWGMPYLEEARALCPNDVRVLRSIVRVQTAAGALSACEPILRRLLEIDPSDREAADVLERIVLGRGAIYDLVAFLEQRVRDSGSVALNPLRVKLAVLHATLPGGDVRACELLAEAHALNPNDVEVLRAFDARLVASQRWGELGAILEERIERAGTDDERVELLVRLARMNHERAGDIPRARALYRAALDLDPTNTIALSALRQLALDLDDVSEAVRLLDREQRHTNDPRARAKLLVELAVLRRDRLDDPRGSKHAFEEAHAADPENDDAALAIAEGHVERSEWSVAEPLLERLARCAGRRPVYEQIAIFGQLGRAHLARGEHSRALDAFHRAQMLGPIDLEIVRGIAEAAFHTGALDEALAAQQKLITASEGDGDRAAHLHRLREIYARAVDAYDASLDDDPRNVDAFRALERLLADDPAATERACRKMILRARTVANNALEFELWHKLGELYRDRLADPASSLEAFRTASRLRPDDSRERRIIAELCVATDRTDLAITELRYAIAREPMDIAHHQALYRLYARTGELDRAYCVASALVFLKGADAEQRACYAELRPRGAPDFRARLGRAAWIRDLAHPELDRGIGSVFEVIGRAARVAKVRALNAKEQLPSLATAKREDPQSTRRLLAKAFFGAAAVLSVDAPQLWVRPDLPGGIAAVPVEPVASLIGSTLLSGWSVPELMFVFGKHLTVQHGEHAVRAHFPSISELQVLLAAAVKIPIPSFAPSAGIADAVHRAHKMLLRELRPDEQQRLGHVVASLVEIGTHSDVTRWVQCSDLTAVRAGLLLCGDLSVAAKILRQESVVAGDLSPTEKVKELVRFTVSDAYSQLRRGLGIDVRTRDLGPLDEDDEPTVERALCA